MCDDCLRLFCVTEDIDFSDLTDQLKKTLLTVKQNRPTHNASVCVSPNGTQVVGLRFYDMKQLPSFVGYIAVFTSSVAAFTVSPTAGVSTNVAS